MEATMGQTSRPYSSENGDAPRGHDLAHLEAVIAGKLISRHLHHSRWEREVRRGQMKVKGYRRWAG